LRRKCLVFFELFAVRGRNRQMKTIVFSLKSQSFFECSFRFLQIHIQTYHRIKWPTTYRFRIIVLYTTCAVGRSFHVTILFIVNVYRRIRNTHINIRFVKPDDEFDSGTHRVFGLTSAEKQKSIRLVGPKLHGDRTAGRTVPVGQHLKNRHCVQRDISHCSPRTKRAA